MNFEIQDKHVCPATGNAHEWRLISTANSGPGIPHTGPIEFVTWRTWYCTRCRLVETTKERS